MKRKLVFISGFSLFSLGLFTLASCSSSENQNSSQSISQQNSVKDMVMNVESKYDLSIDEKGIKTLSISGDADTSKLTNPNNYNNEEEWKKIIFPKGDWKEFNDEQPLGKKYQAQNFSDSSLFAKFFSYGKDFKNLTKDKIKDFDTKDINFNSIPNQYISGYSEIRNYAQDSSNKRIYITLNFSLLNEKIWTATKNNYNVSFMLTVYSSTENSN